MKLTHYEQETIINYNEAESTASVYTHNRPLRRKLEKLAADRPSECKCFRISHDGQAAEVYIPKRWIKISPPRQISQAQREKMRERAKMAFSPR